VGDSRRVLRGDLHTQELPENRLQEWKQHSCNYPRTPTEGYNVVAIPLAAGALYAWGVVLSPAMGAALMAASTVIVAINARLLRLKK